MGIHKEILGRQITARNLVYDKIRYQNKYVVPSTGANNNKLPSGTAAETIYPFQAINNTNGSISVATIVYTDNKPCTGIALSYATNTNEVYYQSEGVVDVPYCNQNFHYWLDKTGYLIQTALYDVYKSEGNTYNCLQYIGFCEQAGRLTLNIQPQIVLNVIL